MENTNGNGNDDGRADVAKIADRINRMLTGKTNDDMLVEIMTDLWLEKYKSKYVKECIVEQGRHADFAKLHVEIILPFDVISKEIDSRK